MKRIAIIAVLVAAVVAGVWFLMRPTPVRVALLTVARGPVAATVANTRAGTVNACRRAGLSPALGGQIAALLIKDGQHVEQGALLLELWNDDIKAELELSQRDARAARSRARETCIVADVAKRDAARLTELRARRLASEESADQAEGKAESAAAGCVAAEDATRVAEARVDVTRAHLERTQLYAPFAGIIAEVNGELGEFVTPSPVGIPTPPTVDLIDASCLYISAPIDEVDAPRITAGLPARISLDAFPDQVFPGHVRRVAPYVLDQEKQARTVEIEAVFDDAKKTGLLAGYSADVEVVLEERDDALRVPSSVILPDKTVYVFNEVTRTIAARAVQTGISNWEFTEIVSGLTAGERVVSSIDREGVRDGAVAAPRVARPPRTTAMMELRGICRQYAVGTEVVHALDHVDLTIRAGEYVSIMGPSGSGKSTLLNILGLLDRPTQGTYLLKGEDVSNLDDNALAQHRQQHIGFIFQFFYLIPRLTALENVELPLVLAGAAARARRERATSVLESVGLKSRMHHRPDQLSGGERQRVAIGRAIVMQPSVLLADEPTGNLDSKSGGEIVQIIEQLNRDGIALLVVTHDPLIGGRARRHLTLHDGRVVGDETSELG